MNINKHILIDAFKQPLPGKEAQLIMSPSVRFTGRKSHNPNQARESSVLILLSKKNDQWHIPFIQRPVYKGAHSGQVSFPGGKTEEFDNTYFDTAIRETEEEIGINRKHVQYIGKLTSLYIPNSNFVVYPHVGISQNEPHYKANPREVETIIEVPLTELTNPKRIKSFSRTINNVQVDAPFFHFDSFEIWGATAMILSEFIEVLKRQELNPLLHSYNGCNAPECQ
ncbi:NUDIX hydrolase [Carboxylicivirga sp. N1Y90]|uniref:NUDIX hydrolase n=1 Tax=Carboxylicivirga fragile TaxID=3417571 RepID=UPI003D328C79|nr:CoA pyrophosphatase [Marinilabiliaceae bacterium N1Y90]